MTDLLHVLLEMRGGQVASDLSKKFQDVLDGVLNNHGRGELQITLKVEPAKLGTGGVVLEVEMTHGTKLKVPEARLGRSVFFVGRDRTLSRSDPTQDELFNETRGSK